MMETEPKPQQKRSAGNPNAADAALTHGYWRAKAALERGLSIIPPDSPLHAFIADRRETIITDLGGRSNLSQLKLDLIEKYIATEILISSTDAYLVALELPRTARSNGRVLAPLSIIDRRSHKLRPIVEQRNRLIETSLKLGAALGLERRAAPVSIQDRIAQHLNAARIPASEPADSLSPDSEAVPEPTATEERGLLE